MILINICSTLVNRADGIVENANKTIESFRSDKSVNTNESEYEGNGASDFLSDAGRTIINQHIDSYIKKKTNEITSFSVFSLNDTKPSSKTVSSQIFVF
jgi:hypothetical protein